MKVLCIYDVGGIDKVDFENATKLYLGNSEVFYEPTDPTIELFKIEQDGPGSVPIPEGMKKPEYKDINVLLGGIVCPFSREIMDMFPDLKIIGTGRGGLENVDMEAAKEKGIIVVNGYGRNAQAVSDFAIGIALAEIRNIGRAYAMLHEKKEWKQGAWPNFEYSPHICEATVGIFGFGYIGKLVCQKYKGFGANIIAYDPFVDEETMKKFGATKVSAEELFKTADIVTIHARLVEATRGVVTKALIDSMKPTAVFINTARAGLVDYDALLAALQEHRIGGAAMDVYPEEPLPENSPWKSLDNCTCLPHMAGGVRAARPYAAKLLAMATVAAMKGDKDTAQVITKDAIFADKFQAWAKEELVKIGL